MIRHIVFFSAKNPKDNRYGLTIKFDVPVDVVKFEGMTNFRSRVNVTLDDNGQSHDKTSDGQPHVVLQM